MKSFHLITPYLIERKKHIACGICALLVVDVLQLFIPRIIKWAIDDIAAMSLPPGGLFMYGGYIMLAAVFIGIFRFCWRIMIMGTSRRIEEGLRELLFSHTQLMSASFFEKVSAGDIMAHATNDIKNIRMATGMGMVAVTDTIVLGCASVFFMGYINLKLTLLALIPMPFIALFTKIYSKKLFREFMNVQAGFSQLMESVRERFAGIKVIKAFGREDFENACIGRESEDYVARNMRLVKYTGLIFPMMIFLTNVSLAVVVGIGGGQVVTGTISAGDFVAFISYLGLLTWPMMAIGWVTNMIQRGKASIERIENILRMSPDITSGEIMIYPGKVNGEIVAENLVFSYGQEGSGTDVISGMNFSISPGQTLGIAGPPGSGKTSLLNLIPRIYDPTGGRLVLDGSDLRDLDTEGLRSAISFMPQEPFLFSGTIGGNLLFGNPDAREPDIKKALEQAGLARTIAEFPAGLETVIGEKGVHLSGGQKQRVALARALLKESRILVLDDPVSQVDMNTAREIGDTIRSFHGKRTVLIASHRYSVFTHADMILVLKEGRVVESGTHADLIRAGGYYARTYAMQVTEERLGEVY